MIFTILLASIGGVIAFLLTRASPSQRVELAERSKAGVKRVMTAASSAASARRSRRGAKNGDSRGLGRIVVFDIEIANEFEVEPGRDLDEYGPFDISVAATMIDGEEPMLWYSSAADGSVAPCLTRDDARKLLLYLERLQFEGYTLVAWNGLGFDMKWIGHAAGDLPRARSVALKLFDPMYQFYKAKGFPVGLAKVGEGLGIPLKKLLDGKDAPSRWNAGDHQVVFDYVKSDVLLTAEVARRIQSTGGVRWITRSGNMSRLAMSPLRTVSSCRKDRLPDQSWMDKPLPDSKFTEWL